MGCPASPQHPAAFAKRLRCGAPLWPMAADVAPPPRLTPRPCHNAVAERAWMTRFRSQA